MLNYDEEQAMNACTAALPAFAGLSAFACKLATLTLLAQLEAKCLMRSEQEQNTQQGEPWRRLERALKRAANTVAVRG